MNDEGAPVRPGNVRDGCGQAYYCGRQLGTDAILGSDVRCGPSNGPQCASCKRYQAELWSYAPMSILDIETRETPEIEGNRTRKTLRPGDMFRVIEEKTFGEVTFLRLAGGEGWLFDTDPNVGRMCTKARGPPLRASEPEVAPAPGEPQAGRLSASFLGRPSLRPSFLP